MFHARLQEVERQMEDLQKMINTLKFKCWYYDTAVAAGSEAAVKELPPDRMPEDIREYRIYSVKNPALSPFTLTAAAEASCGNERSMTIGRGFSYTGIGVCGFGPSRFAFCRNLRLFKVRILRKNQGKAASDR